MALTPLELQSSIDALNRAIGSGERQVTMNGYTVTYRSIADLIDARNDLQRQVTAIAAADGVGKPRPKQWLGYYKGRGY